MTTTGRSTSVSLPVADQDRAKAFYTEVLGFEVRSDAEALPGTRIQDYPPMFFFADPDGNGLVCWQG